MSLVLLATSCATSDDTGAVALPPASPTGAASPAVAASSTPPVTASATPSAAPSPSRARQAVDATKRAASSRRGTRLGVAVLDRATGTLEVNDEADTAVNSASLSKLLTVVDMLDRRAAGTVRVPESDLRLVARALGPSDDGAMNALWSRYGGPAGITRVIQRLKLQDTTPPDDSSQWGEVQLSARDMVTVFRHVYEMAPADRALVLDDLQAAPSTAADGFDQGFGLLDPATRGTAVAKQGWLCCLQQSIDLHSAGAIDRDGRYLVALTSKQAFGYPAARTVLNNAASAVRRAVAG